MKLPIRVFCAFFPFSLLALSAPARADYTAPQGAIFNRPTAAGPGEENVIQDHLVDLARHAVPGSEIKVALYTWREEPFKNALLKAYERGVRVQVLLNNAADTKSEKIYSDLVRTLGEYSPEKSSWAAQCHQGWGCLGTGIDHNKFFLFSQVGRSGNVVVQSSANLTRYDRLTFWNNAYTASDPGLYRLYDEYFYRLQAGINRTTAPDNDAFWMGESGPYRLYTNPYKGPDVLLRELDSLRCSTSFTAPTQIRVAAFQFTRPALAERLVALQEQGCRVHLVFQHLGKEVSGLFEHRLSGIKKCPREQTVHSKYMAISTGAGTFEGRRRQRLVFTGSHNYGYGALRENDETLLRIVDPEVYQQYEDNFDEGPYAHCPFWGATEDGARRVQG